MMVRKVRLLATVVGLCCATAAIAQPPSPPTPLRDRIFFGGNLGGLSLSSDFVVIDISPIVGYKVTEKFAVGTGPIYQYVSSNGFSTHNYGGKVFARHIIWESVFAHTEYELLNYKYWFMDPVSGSIESNRRTVGSFFVGGGISQSLGGRSALYIMALYDLLYREDYSPRNSPLYLTMGFGFGI